MKSLVVSVCITAVTDMAAVSLLVFFWCSSGFFWVLLVFFCVIEHQKNTRRTPEEHQKNTRRNARRTQKNPEGEEHQPPLKGNAGAGAGVVLCKDAALWSGRTYAGRNVLFDIGRESSAKRGLFF